MAGSKTAASETPRSLRFSDWVRRFDGGDTPPAHFLCGPETLLRDQALARIRARTLGPGDARFGYRRFYGAEAPLGELNGALAGSGLFASATLAVLDDAERCARGPAAERKDLLRRLEVGDLGGSAFVALSTLTISELERKNEFARALLRVCRVVELDHPRPADALRWLLAESERRGIRLDARAGRFLLSRVGPDLQELSRELEKIEIGLSAGAAVGEEDVRHLVRRGALGSGWEFCSAAVDGRSAEALRLWQAVHATEPVLRTQWLLQRQARAALAAAGPPNLPRLRDLLLRLHDLESALKGGLVPGRQDAAALELAVLSADPAVSRVGAPVRPVP
jgi:DNA polymerase III delta subunit